MSCKCGGKCGSDCACKLKVKPKTATEKHELEIEAQLLDAPKAKLAEKCGSREPETVGAITRRIASKVLRDKGLAGMLPVSPEDVILPDPDEIFEDPTKDKASSEDLAEYEEFLGNNRKPS